MVFDSGIYGIFCETTNKTYIGSSAFVGKRIKTHLSQLRRGKHINKTLQQEYDLLGEGSFAFNVIAKLEPWMLSDAEKAMIDNFRTNGRALYNRDTGKSHCETYRIKWLKYARSRGVSVGKASKTHTAWKATSGQEVSVTTAKKIAAALGVKPEKLV